MSTEEDLTYALRSFYDSKVKINSEGKDLAKEIVDTYIKGLVLKYIKKNSDLPLRKLEYTGSTYEKLKTEAADEVDIMVVMETNKGVTVEKVEEVPGWVRLKCVEGSPYRKYANPEGYLITGKMLSWMQSIVQKAKNEIVKENPQMSETIKSRAHGPAIQLDITDKETGHELSADLVVSFEFGNDFYVAKPYKSTKAKLSCDTLLLFRQSFSLKEKALLRDMDRMDHGCRHILLRIVKTIVRNETALKGKITTYHLKTAFLRLNKQKGEEEDYFHRDMLGARFQEFVSILIDALNKQSLPHFWVDGIDLLEDVEDIVLKNMATRLENILKKNNELYKILGVDPPSSKRPLTVVVNTTQSEASQTCSGGETDEKLVNDKPANKSTTAPSAQPDELISLLRAFTSAMGKVVSKEIKWAKEVFNTHVKNGVLRICQEKHPDLISKFEWTGNLYDNLKIAGKDDDDVTVLITLKSKKKKSDVIHDVRPGFAEFRVPDDNESSQYSDFCDVEKFILPGKVMKWLFAVVREVATRYQTQSNAVEIKVSQLRDNLGVRLEIKEVGNLTCDSVLLVNLVPTFEAEEKVFATRLPLGALDGQETRRMWGQSFALDEKIDLTGMDGTDHGCRHELFKIVKAIIKREPTFAKLVGHLKGIFLEYRDYASPGRGWGKDDLGERFTEFLEYLRDILISKELKHHWLRQNGVNLLEGINSKTLDNMTKRLERILSSEQERKNVLVY